MRNDISQKRLAAIDHCWEELCEGDVVSIEQLLKQFDSNNHPHNRCMIKAPEKILYEFETAIRRRSADGRHLT